VWGSPNRHPIVHAQSAVRVAIFVRGRIKYVDRPGHDAPPPLELPPPEPVKKPRAAKTEKPPAPKFDPTYLAKARELRDRYLERVNATPDAIVAIGKYDVSRAQDGAVGMVVENTLPPSKSSQRQLAA
jgi:hypothetical protein